MTARTELLCAECGTTPGTRPVDIAPHGPRVWCPVCWDWRPYVDRPPDPTLFEPSLPVDVDAGPPPRTTSAQLAELSRPPQDPSAAGADYGPMDL